MSHEEPELTIEQVQNAIETVQLKGDALKAAKRTATALHNRDSDIDDADAGNLKMIMALRSLGVAKILPAVFKTWKGKIQQEEAIQESIWLVSKDSKPNLSEDLEVAEWIIDPADIVGRIDKSAWWFVSKGASHLRHKLGKRVQTWKTALRHIETARPADNAMQQRALTAPSGSGAVPAPVVCEPPPVQPTITSG